MKRFPIFVFLLVLVAACSKDNTSASTADTIPERNIPTGTIPTPGWDVAPDYDYTSSMTAVVEVDLTTTWPDITPVDWQVDTADLLAAFAGEDCIGVTSPTQSEKLFFLYISSPSESSADITLRYYSARLRNVFLADAVLHFENGGRMGSVAEPLTPAFVEFKTE